MKTSDITNINDMQRYIEGCINDYSENLCTKEELLNELKEYTFKVICLTIDTCKANNLTVDICSTKTK